ncbi:hypothetical protein [Actinoplanes xinjiangensis]|uniref:hypothetical protein n=1 Tax=Actinoplanes xinjiangensis TaxID=512350 RepID=UPI003425F685
MTGAEFEGVDIDLLADYVGGALDGTPDEERVAALVATDDAWRAAHEALEPGMIAVGAVLRELEPEPMPDDLAARLDTMFRAAPSEEAAPEAVPAKVVDLDKARRRRRWVAPITVAAAVVAFAGFGVNAFLASGAEDTASRAVDSEAAPMAAGPAAGREVSRSGTDYTASTLTSVGQQLRNAPSSADGPQTASGTELQEASGLDRLTMPDAVAACLQEITRVNGGGVISVEFLDYARFNGDPALIVRFSAADGIWVWAVGPECGTPGAGADELERVPVR